MMQYQKCIGLGKYAILRIFLGKNSLKSYLGASESELEIKNSEWGDHGITGLVTIPGASPEALFHLFQSSHREFAFQRFVSD